MPIAVSIVEDERDFRETLRTLIQGTPGYRCASSHATAEEALRVIPIQQPDVVLMDIRLPKLSGIDCVARLRASVPKTQILMLTVVEDSDQIFDALRVGAAGYLIKGTPLAEIMEAIAEVHRGGSPMSSSIARKVVRYFHQLRPASPALELLTGREQEVLKHLAEGQRDQQIADALGVSLFTIRSHVRNIYDKLQVHSRAAAAVKFLRK